ncbi:MAG: sulfotransferase [Motiliproteus sp.]
MTPIFIISLPRSGSTLLQRILMTSASIRSVSEPWVALPLAYMLKEDGVETEYGHQTWVQAANQLGRDNVLNCARAGLDNIYSNLAEGRRYFLDKTPRYTLILKELFEIYPDAKYIFLLRDPADIVASSILSFRNNSLRRVDHLDMDHILSPGLIAEYIKEQSIDSICIKYEELVGYPSSVVNELHEFLEICDIDIDKGVNITLDGLGDHKQRLTNKIEKKKSVGVFCSNRVRSWWLRKILSEHYRSYMDQGGYQLENIAPKHKEWYPIGLADLYMIKTSDLMRYIKKLLGVGGKY